MMSFYKILGAVFILFSASTVFATEFRSGKRIEITVKDTVSGDVYASGESIFNSGMVQGDLIAAGRTLQLGGIITQDFIGAAESITISGLVGDDVRAAGRYVYVSNGGAVVEDFIAFGEEIIIYPNAVILGNVIARGARVRIEGTVQGNVDVEAGEIFFSGKIGGSAKFKAKDEIRVTDGAEVWQNFTYIMEDSLKVINEDQVGGIIKYRSTGWRDLTETFDESFGEDEVFSLFNTIIAVWQFVSALVVGIVFFAVFRGKAAGMLDHMRENALKSSVTGLIWFILIPIIVLVLFIMIVTIPVAMIFTFVFLLLCFLGYILTAALLGEIILNSFDRSGGTPYLSMFLGLVVFAVIGFAPYVGTLAKLFAVIFGLGGLLLARPSRAVAED